MNSVKRYSQAAAIHAVSLLFLLGAVGCAIVPTSAEGKSALVKSSADTLAQAMQSDSSLKNVIDKSAGYAVFPSVGKGAIGIGGAYGRGDVYENGVVVGFCDMSQATIGFQLGGQDYSEIIVFQSADAVERFKHGNFRFDAQATAVALKSGAGANAKFANGVAVFTMNESGLMYEASVGGQKFSYQDK